MANAANLVELSNDEIADAVHFLEGHSDGLEGAELRAWERMRDHIIDIANTARTFQAELDAERSAPATYVDLCAA